MLHPPSPPWTVALSFLPRAQISLPPGPDLNVELRGGFRGGHAVSMPLPLEVAVAAWHGLALFFFRLHVISPGNDKGSLTAAAPTNFSPSP